MTIKLLVETTAVSREQLPATLWLVGHVWQLRKASSDEAPEYALWTDPIHEAIRQGICGFTMEDQAELKDMKITL
jgi:hypothetical protein